MRGLNKNKSAPAPLDTAHTHCGHCSCTLARQGQRAAQPSGSAYITLPVLGSMRLPATKPVVGSVPLGRRKSRMCGSGLAAAGAGAGAEAGGGGRCGGRLRACDQVAHATRERWIAG